MSPGPIGVLGGSWWAAGRGGTVPVDILTQARAATAEAPSVPAGAHPPSLLPCPLSSPLIFLSSLPSLLPAFSSLLPLEGMPQRDLKPDVISYSAATGACEKGGQWRRALAVLEGMPQRALTPT